MPDEAILESPRAEYHQSDVHEKTFLPRQHKVVDGFSTEFRILLNAAISFSDGK